MNAFVFQRPQGNLPEIVGSRFGVGQPFRIGRPAQAHASAFQVGTAHVDGFYALSFQVHQTNSYVVVGERNVFAIGRPGGFPAQFRFANGNALWFIAPVLAADKECIALTAFI